MSDLLISIFCRWPTPGEAKTRLIPGFGANGAAAIYTKLLRHTISVARDSGIAFELRVTGAPIANFMAEFGNDLSVVGQGGGDLTDKLSRVSAPAIVIGSDCPGLTSKTLVAARDALADTAMVIGPAKDGGYYLLGYNQPSDFAFANMEWSTDTVFAETMKRCEQHGLQPAILPELSDVDTAADLKDWPEFLP